MRYVVAAEHPGPRFLDLHYGAFVITPVSLQSFDKLLTDFAGQSVEKRYSVEFTDKEPQAFDSIDALISVRNAATAQIRAIYLVATSEHSAARIILNAGVQRSCAAIVVEAVCGEQRVLSKLSIECRDEVVNSRLRYWQMRALVDKLLFRFSRVPLWGFAVIGIAGVAAVTWDVWHRIKYAEWRRGAEAILRSADDVAARGAALPEAVSKDVEAIRQLVSDSSHSSALPTLLLWISMGAVLGLVLPPTLTWAFPRVVFAVGDGVERYEHVKRVRNLLFGSILLSGLGLPMLVEWLLR